MKRCVRLLAALTVVVGAAIPALAQTVPVVEMKVIANGTPYDYSAFFTVTPSGKGWSLNDPTTGEPRHLFVDGLCDIKLSGFLNPDPSVTYGFTAQNFTGLPMNFTFSVTQPIVLGPGATTVAASVSGGVTDTLSDGISVVPIAARLQTNEVLDGALNPTNMGVDVGLALVAGAGGASYPYGSYSLGPQAGPASPPWAHMRVTNAFVLSPDFDVASFTGYAEITPEPLSLMAFGTGLAMLAVRRRRARRN